MGTLSLGWGSAAEVCGIKAPFLAGVGTGPLSMDSFIYFISVTMVIGAKHQRYTGKALRSKVCTNLANVGQMVA